MAGDISEKTVLGGDCVAEPILDPHEVAGQGRKPDLVNKRHIVRLRR